MERLFLKRERNPRLLLFFGGWGAEKAMFDPPAMEGYDCLLCYDYREMSFDAAPLAEYDGIRLLAWSMGVWAAEHTLAGLDLPWERKMAVNGTPTPIDDLRGIPTTIFHGTLAGFSETTLTRFRRRMCGSAAAAERLAESGLSRPAEELRDELAALGRMARNRPARPFVWDRALIGNDDRIFPAANQRNAWRHVPYQELAATHYDRELFRTLLCEETLWTND